MDRQYFTATMLSTTNPSFQQLVGKTSEYIFTGHSLRSQYFTTSYVKKTELTDDILTVTTRNSVYTFKVIDNIQNVITKELSQDKVKEFEDYIDKTLGMFL